MYLRQEQYNFSLVLKVVLVWPVPFQQGPDVFSPFQNKDKTNPLISANEFFRQFTGDLLCCHTEWPDSVPVPG